MIEDRVVFGGKIKVNYFLKDATGSISINVWQETLVGFLRVSAEEIWRQHEACDPDTAGDPEDAAQQFADALNVISNEEKVFIIKCTMWKDFHQFTLIKVEDSL